MIASALLLLLFPAAGFLFLPSLPLFGRLLLAPVLHSHLHDDVPPAAAPDPDVEATGAAEAQVIGIHPGVEQFVGGEDEPG